MAVSTAESDQVWQLRNIESSYWDEYIATRPTYNERIFGPIYEYHEGSSPSPGWSAALDIGSGSGSAIKPLTERFERVVASDNDPTSLAFAQKRHTALLPDGGSNKVSYTLSKGEDLLQHHAPASFDLITCAETFPLMDTQVALDNVHALLRPGGTLALWFYGPPFFTEPEYAARCQPILDRLLDNKFRPVMRSGGEAGMRSWKRAAEGKFSRFDYIPFDPSRWADVRRHKWNTSARLSFFTEDACDFPVEPESRVAEGEKCTEAEDHSFWRIEWDAAMLTRFVKAAFPTPRDVAKPDEDSDRLFAELVVAMGGEGKARQFSWPAVLVLASKKTASEDDE